MTEIANRLTGRIIKVNQNGWGFISSLDIKFTRIFFHWTALTRESVEFPEIRTGMWVEFTPVKIPIKGWRAVHVKVIEREKPHVEPELRESEVEGSMPTLPEQ